MGYPRQPGGLFAGHLPAVQSPLKDSLCLEEFFVTAKTRILFVCLGNIIRSPLAENLFRHLAAEAGVLDKYEVDSAGTAAYHLGEPPDARMRRVAAARGLHYSGRARQIDRQDFSHFDYLIAMDASNRDDLYRLARTPAEKAKIHLLREFDPLGDADEPVPDPYYGGLSGFDNVFDIIARSSQELLNALEMGELSLQKAAGK